MNEANVVLKTETPMPIIQNTMTETGAKCLRLKQINRLSGIGGNYSQLGIALIYVRLGVAVKPRMKGFTLIELLVTVAVAAVLLTVAIPGLQSFIVRNNLAATNNDLMTALNLARSEAIKRATTVSVCRTNDNGVTCAGTWSDGWMVFVNTDNDSPAVKDNDAETLLRVFPALPAGYTLIPTNNFTNSVTYDRSGAANNIGTFAVCNDSDESTARGVVLTRLRPRLAVAADIATCEEP